jgi:hypothetical protein
MHEMTDTASSKNDFALAEFNALRDEIKTHTTQQWLLERQAILGTAVLYAVLATLSRYGVEPAVLPFTKVLWFAPPFLILLTYVRWKSHDQGIARIGDHIAVTYDHDTWEKELRKHENEKGRKDKEKRARVYKWIRNTWRSLISISFIIAICFLFVDTSSNPPASGKETPEIKVTVGPFHNLDDIMQQMLQFSKMVEQAQADIRYVREQNISTQNAMANIVSKLANVTGEFDGIDESIREIEEEIYRLHGVLENAREQVKVDVTSIMGRQTESIEQTQVALRTAVSEINEFKAELSRLQIGLTKSSDQLSREGRWK